MTQEIKYTHEELVTAVDRIEELGDFSTRVEASERAGEILNQALDKMEKTVVKETSNMIEKETSDDLPDGFQGEEFSL